MNILGICSISKKNFPKKRSTMTDEEKAKIKNLIKDICIIRPIKFGQPTLLILKLP